MKLSKTLNTKQTMSPNMLRMMEILQLNTVELRERLFEEAMENPLIELDKLYEAPTNDLGEQIQWLNSFNVKQAPQDEADRLWDMDGSPDKFEPAAPLHIRTELLRQLSMLSLNETENYIARYLIGCTDSRGFLDEDTAEAAELLAVEAGQVEAVLEMLRNLSPVGVCSRNIQECLLAQSRVCCLSDIAIRIINEHLSSLAHGHFSAIARKMDISVGQVHEAAAQLKRLYPYPCMESDCADESIMLLPDIYIDCVDGELDITLGSSFQPYLNINSEYLKLLRQTSDPETRKFLEEKLNSAKQLFENVSLRESTLLKCAKGIAQIQREYFLNSHAALAPMTLADVAESIDVSPSTVSRTVSGKYIQSARGLMPMKALFSKKVSTSWGRDISSSGVAGLMQAIIDGEDKSAPYSDAEICQIMTQNGITVSRRTIAYLRSSLNIPSTLLRKDKP